MEIGSKSQTMHGNWEAWRNKKLGNDSESNNPHHRGYDSGQANQWIFLQTI